MAKQLILYSQVDDMMPTGMPLMSEERSAEMSAWHDSIPTPKLSELRDQAYARATFIPTPDKKYAPQERKEALATYEFYDSILRRRRIGDSSK